MTNSEKVLDKSIVEQILQHGTKMKSGVGLAYDKSGIPGFQLVSKLADRITGLDFISGRNLEEIGKELPTVSERILRENGKIVIIGNGFSPVPLILAQRHRNKTLAHRPVINDIFDYFLLVNDLDLLEETFTREKVTFPFVPVKYISQRLVSEAQQQNLHIVKYRVGSGNPPNTLKEANLLINCWGVSNATLDEQLSFLAVGGELFCKSKGKKWDEPFFKLRPLLFKMARLFSNESDDEPKGFVIRRLQ